MRVSYAGWVLVAVVASLSAGCAKRPSLTVASAPAPVAPAPAVPAPAPMPVAPAPVAPPPVAAPAPTPAAVAPQPAPAPQEFAANAALRGIQFEFDKSEIRAADVPVLEANARWLRDNPRQLLLIEGHCDERGTDAYNLALGDRRAKTAMQFLVSRGVAAERLSVVSYGLERPLCADKTEACWAENRRAALLTRER
jgi:peptidoglycan-associated lipoprotein